MVTRTHIYPCKRYYWFTDSPVAEWLEDFSAWLKVSGYAECGIRRHVAALRFSLEPHAPIPRGHCFSVAELERLIVCPQRPRGFRAARAVFARFLRSCDQLDDAPSEEPYAVLIAAYREYLTVMRGLAPATVGQHERVAKQFLKAALPASGRLDDLTCVEVEHFLSERSEPLSRSSFIGLAAYLRVFLRFCAGRGEVAEVVASVDIPRRYRHERPPRAIPWSLIEQLLDSIDRRTPVGLRDHAIFFLMAHYGLRTGEIPLLRLDSIDWDANTLRVEQSKTRSVLLLPLLDPAKAVLERYLREGRAECSRPELFPRLIAPTGPLTRGAIAQAYRRHVRRSGLPLRGSSPYGLRHAFAMRLLERNVGVKAIGDLLGHRNLDATGRYLRIQLDALREVGLPLPSGNGERGGSYAY